MLELPTRIRFLSARRTHSEATFSAPENRLSSNVFAYTNVFAFLKPS